MALGLGLIILCGLLALVYGGVTITQVMAAPAGSARMQEISGAVREGAQAYLRRQYLTIAVVGIIVFAGLWFLLSPDVAAGFAIGAILSGAAGFIGMNVSVRANVRTAQAATESLAGGLDIAFKSGAVTGMLVAGLALLGVSGLFLRADRPDASCAGQPRRHRLAGGARLRRVADLDLRPSRRRHLHQGRRRRRRPRRQGRGRHSRGRSAQSGDHRRQRRRQCRRLRGHGGRPVRDLRGDGRRDDGAGVDLLRGQGHSAALDDLSAGDLRRVHPHLHRGRLFRQAGRRQLDHGRALQGPDRDRPSVDRRPRHRDHFGRRLGRVRRSRRPHADGRQPVHLRHRRPHHHRPDRRHHRILHRHGQAPGGVDRAGLGHRSRHQRDPGPRRVARIRRRFRPSSSSSASSPPISSPASTARRSRSRRCWASPA